MQTFMCVDRSPIFFKGSLLSSSNSYFVFDMTKCSLGEGECASASEIQSYFDQHAVIGITNSNFISLEDYDNPFQSFLHYTLVDQMSVNDTVYRTVNLGLNEAYLNDDQFEIFDTKNLDLLFVNTESQEFSTLRSFNPGAYYTARFQIHDMIFVHNRYVYDILQLIGDVGGAGQLVSFIGAFLVSLISAKVFFTALIRDTFRVRLDANKSSIVDLL